MLFTVYFAKDYNVYNKNIAFTLSEILITLGIIGVIAALTMPGLITNFQKRATVTKLKETYSIFNQAVRHSEEDNGTIDSWDWENNRSHNGDYIRTTYLANYLKMDKLSSWQTRGLKWKTPNGSINNHYQVPQYALHNGVWLAFYQSYLTGAGNHHKIGLWIIVDLNGKSGPNRYGRDVFVMSIYPFLNSDEKIVMGAHDQCGSGAIHRRLSRESLLNGGCATCKKDKTGWGFGCSRVIQMDGWQIRDDYPW